MKPNYLLLVLLFVANSFAQTTEIISLDYPQLQPLIAFFYSIVRQSHQMVANTCINMHFNCDGNGIDAKNGTCKDLGQHK